GRVIVVNDGIVIPHTQELPRIHNVQLAPACSRGADVELANARAVLRRAMSQIKFRRRTLFSAFDTAQSIDPELERWAKYAFDEFKNKPLFEPSRDLSRAV